MKDVNSRRYFESPRRSSNARDHGVAQLAHSYDGARRNCAADIDAEAHRATS
jgi:hypothetical protein